MCYASPSLSLGSKMSGYLRGGGTLLQPMQVDGRVITPNLFVFFMVPIHPNLQRNFFVGGGGGLGEWWVGLGTRARNLLLRTCYNPGIRSSVFDSGALF